MMRPYVCDFDVHREQTVMSLVTRKSEMPKLRVTVDSMMHF